jgi:hypothetical protein
VVAVLVVAAFLAGGALALVAVLAWIAHNVRFWH